MINYVCRLENNSIETFFDPKGLPPLNYKVQEYCTCTADKSIQGQSSEPNFKCKLSRGMKACRQIETSTTVYHASCITSNHRQKRSLEEEDEAPPMYDMMDDEQVEVDDVNIFFYYYDIIQNFVRMSTKRICRICFYT